MAHIRHPVWIATGAVAALAALSLSLPYTPVYDAWAWLVWGRELAALDLETGAGPSWKPLPVLVTAPLSVLGGAAPDAWLFVARVGWIAAAVLAGCLAARLAGPETGWWRAVAAVVAAASVALTYDAFTPAVRQFAGGLSEPLLTALVLGAVALALRGRPVAALWVGAAASLLRPECWPFLVLWAAWEWRREPALRPHAIAAAIVVPVAWFLPDLLVAGDPLEGPTTARGDEVAAWEGVEVLGRAAIAPLAAVWLGVALLFADRGARRDPVLLALLGGAVAWIAVVAVMAALGFAGIPRFFAPATAIVSVLGAAGIARAGAMAATQTPGGRDSPQTATQISLTRLVAGLGVGIAVVLAAGGIGVRVAAIPDDLRPARGYAHSLEELFTLVDRVGADALLSCDGRVRVTGLLIQTPLAWKLEQPISAVDFGLRPRRGAVIGTNYIPARRLASSGRWRASLLPCPYPPLPLRERPARRAGGR